MANLAYNGIYEGALYENYERIEKHKMKEYKYVHTKQRLHKDNYKLRKLRKTKRTITIGEIND